MGSFVVVTAVILGDKPFVMDKDNQAWTIELFTDEDGIECELEDAEFAHAYRELDGWITIELERATIPEIH
jgi:hypothetical protein